MAEDASVPGTGDGAGEGSTPPAAAAATGSGDGGGSVASQASVEGGHAPALGGDAAPGEGGQAVAAPSTPGEFVFAGRRFKDQAAAEAFHASLAGRVPETQRRLAALERQLQAREDELDRVSRAGGRGGDRGPGGTPNEEPPALGAWGDELHASGDLQLIAELAEKSPAHMVYALTNVLGERVTKLMEQAINGYHAAVTQPMATRAEFNENLGRVYKAAKGLATEYPELDERFNDNPEAEQVRQEILGIWQSYPREWALQFPEESLVAAVLKYRRANGVPVWAVPPGSSGSTSARVAAAAERQAAGQATVLDGTATPRPRPKGQPRTAQEELADDLAEVDGHTLKSKEGVSLGVRRVV